MRSGNPFTGVRGPIRAQLNHKTSSHAYCCLFSVSRHSSQRRLHLDSAHRRPHAYLNIVKTIVAEPPSPADLKLMSQVLRPLRLTLPVVAAGFIGIHCLRSLVCKFFNRASRLRLCGSEPSNSYFLLRHERAVPESSEFCQFWSRNWTFHRYRELFTLRLLQQIIFNPAVPFSRD